MPIYEGRIIVRRIDKPFKFPAENEKEAWIRMKEFLDKEVDDSTMMECYLEGTG